MRAKQKNENKTCAKFDIYIAYREALQFYYSSRVCSIRHTCKGLHEILLAPLLLLLFRYSYRSRFTTFANARLLFVLTLRRRLLKKVRKEGRIENVENETIHFFEVSAIPQQPREIE